MSLLEFLGEIFVPGDIASLEYDEPAKYRPRNYLILILGIISLGILITSLVLIIIHTKLISNLILYFSLIALYLLIAYRFKMNIPMRNIGLFGTPINNPFRISDNINRIALIIEFLFVPGKIISVSIANFSYLLKRYWCMRKFIHLKH